MLLPLISIISLSGAKGSEITWTSYGRSGLLAVRRNIRQHKNHFTGAVPWIIYFLFNINITKKWKNKYLIIHIKKRIRDTGLDTYIFPNEYKKYTRFWNMCYITVCIHTHTHTHTHLYAYLIKIHRDSSYEMLYSNNHLQHITIQTP